VSRKVRNNAQQERCAVNIIKILQKTKLFYATEKHMIKIYIKGSGFSEEVEFDEK
jgi:hypothetical protein